MGQQTGKTIIIRQSNFELLRIVAMLFVLIYHADFWSLGCPTKEDFIAAPFSAGLRMIIEFFTIVCVNVFIFISGWFKIKPSIMSFANFAFQCIFILAVVYIALLISGKTTLSIKGIMSCFAFGRYDWFIKSYIGLYVLAPILNAFIERSNIQLLGLVIISFYLFQTLYGMTGSASFIQSGFSTFSFIGLYLIGAWLRLTYNCKSNTYRWGGGYLSP